MALGGRYARLFTLQAAAYTGASIEGLVDMGGIAEPRRTSIRTPTGPTERRPGDSRDAAAPSGMPPGRRAGDEPCGPALRPAAGHVRPRRRSLAVATAAGRGPRARRSDRPAVRRGPAVRPDGAAAQPRSPIPGRTRPAGSGRRPPRAADGSSTSTPTRCSGAATCCGAPIAARSTSRGWSRATSRSRSSPSPRRCRAT